MQKTGITYLSLDWLVMGFTNGIPEYGIHDKLWPNEIAERFWAFLEAMLESMIFSKTDCIIEGEAVLPKLIQDFLKTHPEDVKLCFVGFTKISISKKVKEVRKYSQGKGDWLTQESDAYVKDHIGNMIVYSKRIKNSCGLYQMPYFDTSENFMDVLEQAEHYLLEEI